MITWGMPTTRRPDPHGARLQVDIAAPQRGHFAPSQAGEGGQQDERQVAPVMVAVGPVVVGHLP
jgi:hypothetical protein